MRTKEELATQARLCVCYYVRSDCRKVNIRTSWVGAIKDIRCPINFQDSPCGCFNTTHAKKMKRG